MPRLGARKMSRMDMRQSKSVMFKGSSMKLNNRSSGTASRSFLPGVPSALHTSTYDIVWSKNKEENIEEFEVVEINECFKIFDIDGNSRITTNEIMSLMRFIGEETTENEVEDIVDLIDRNQNKAIDIDEFFEIMARLFQNQQQYLEEALAKTFNFFDKTYSGFIKPESIKEVMSQMGENLEDDEVQEIMDEIDSKRDGLIDVEEFTNYLRNSINEKRTA